MADTAQKYYLPVGLPEPAPYPEGLGKEYWDAARNNELVVQRCNACKTWQWGPEFICHKCFSTDYSYEKVSGKGILYSWERAWYPVHPALKDAVPYVVVLVELPDAGNVRMVGNLIGDPTQEIVIGSKVEAVYEHHNDADPPFTLVHWKVVS